MAKPRPVPKELICSECGLDWEDHPKNPDRGDCIELLKGELEKKSPHCWTHHYHGFWCSCGCHQQPSVWYNSPTYTGYYTGNDTTTSTYTLTSNTLN